MLDKQKTKQEAMPGLPEENAGVCQTENGTGSSDVSHISEILPVEDEQQKAESDILYAGFFPRLTAYLIDCVLAGVPVALLALAGLWLRQAGIAWLSADILFRINGMDILCYLVFTAYFVVFTVLTGATPGKRVMRLRVTMKTGEQPDWMTVLYRETVGRYLTGILLIGYLVLLCDAQHRGFHDMLSDTRVVYAR